VLNLLQARPDLNATLDFALVDEGQDLSATAFEILRRVARHVTVFADHQQQIFQGGASEAEILRTFNLPRRNATLLAAYRNSPDVAQIAAYFIRDEESRASYLSQTHNNQIMRERPLCFIASTYDEEMNRLAEIIKGRLMKNERVGIVVGQNRQVFGFAKAMEERGIQVAKAVKQKRGGGGDDGVESDSFDPHNTLPQIATYHSAKGLTFDSVMLPRLCESAFPRVHDAARERLLFVGITRATQWVYLSTVQNNQMKEFATLKAAAESNHATLQWGNMMGLFNPPTSPADDDVDEFSIL